MFFKKILYGKNYRYLYEQDAVLMFFCNTDFYTTETFYKTFGDLPDINEIINKLNKEGFIKISANTVSITLLGKIKIKSGGFLRESLLKRLARIGVTVGVIASLLAIVQYFRS